MEYRMYCINGLSPNLLIDEMFEVEDQHELSRSQYVEIIGNKIFYSSAIQQLFNQANDEDRHFTEFNNFISMKERRVSLKSCGSIKSSLSCLVEEK